MTSIPQPFVDNLVDQVDHQIPKNDEQPIEQHDPQENVDATLRRSTRVRKSVIPSDYNICKNLTMIFALKMILKFFIKPWVVKSQIYGMMPWRIGWIPCRVTEFGTL